MATLDDLRTRLDQILQDAAGRLAAAARDGAIFQAIADYSRDRPRRVVLDIAGSGAFDLALPADWVEGFSHIVSIEYPAGRRDPVVLESGAWSLYTTPAGKVLRLLDVTPASGETVRINYTVPHRDDGTTLPAADLDALADLAAAIAFEKRATLMAEGRDPTLAADVAGSRAHAEDFAARAREARRRYNERLGKEGQPGAATGAADWDIELGAGGDRITHPGRGTDR